MGVGEFFGGKMSEREKMLAGQLYNHYDKQLTTERKEIAEKVFTYNGTRELDKQQELLPTMLGKVGNNVEIKIPFMCDYGYNIEIGDNVFINYNCTMLDCNKIKIGNNVLIAPNVQFYAATHPVEYEIRLQELEMAYPIIVEDNVWIGGGAIICPGVKIGKNTVIGAGSVVVKDMSQENEAYIQTYIGDNIIASQSNKFTDIEKQITGMEIIIPDDFSSYVQQEVVKVIVLQEPERLKELEKQWKPLVENKLYMTISKPFFLEFMNLEVDKGKSILRLGKMLGIDAEEIIAIGDSYNDITMIQAAGLGVAMGNAVETVKEIANYITEDNEHDGVAAVVEKFIWEGLYDKILFELPVKCWQLKFFVEDL